MIDLHAHILPGVDDGVRSMEEALDLARASAAEGVTAIAATPHVREDFPTTPDRMEAALAELRGEIERAGIPVAILAGGELALDHAHRLDATELSRYALGGGRYLLVETPYYGWTSALEAVVASLAGLGFSCVIAHPERNGQVQEKPDRLRPLLELGALVQVTAASLDGRLGRTAAKAARALVDRGYAHLLATDAHAPEVRGGGLKAAADTLGNPALAHWLTEAVPRAVVEAAPIPPRPPSKRRFAFR